MVALVDQSLALISFKLGEMLESLRVSRDQGSPAEERGMLLHTMSLSPLPGIRDGLLLSFALRSISTWFSTWLRIATLGANSSAYLQRILDDVESDRLAATSTLRKFIVLCT